MEMAEYCEEQIHCRRKLFAAAFGSIHLTDPPPFQRCEDMCDNCNVRHGIPRKGLQAAMSEEYLEECNEPKGRRGSGGGKTVEKPTGSKVATAAFRSAKELTRSELITIDSGSSGSERDEDEDEYEDEDEDDEDDEEDNGDEGSLAD